MPRLSWEIEFGHLLSAGSTASAAPLLQLVGFETPAHPAKIVETAWTPGEAIPSLRWSLSVPPALPLPLLLRYSDNCFSKLKEESCDLIQAMK